MRLMLNGFLTHGADEVCHRVPCMPPSGVAGRARYQLCHRIAENTEPLSTKIIPSGGPAKGVLEVIAGTAKKYGIEPGDRVAHPLFNGR